MIGAFFAMLLPTIQNCLNGQYDVSLFQCFTILFLFWSSSIILRKLVSRFSELNKNNDVVILGSSFVGALAYTFRIAFGIMPLKRSLCHGLLIYCLVILVGFALGTRHGQTKR
jgi:hypothetical protein